MKTKENRGISLIVLVITIIVIIILATAVIVTILDNNPISSALRAVEESNIAKYKEQIELIRGKLQLQNEDYSLPTLYQMKETLDKEKWVSSTEMIMDEGIEKLKLTTKEGYIFYITGEEVEYKGKGGIVVDTSALKRDDVLELKGEDTTEKGQNIRITSKAEDYYTIKYKIEEDGEWKEIESGSIVEVEYGKTIYAKLVYGSNSGIEFKLKVEEIKPTVVAKNIDTSNIVRKAENPFANMFDITWGSQGTGEVSYEITGNMLFNNKVYSNTVITNTKELELGRYNVKCTIKSPTGYTTSAVKENVNVLTLASTFVTNNSGTNVNAKAIYSEYDLSYFRDLINGGQNLINAKLMNNIDMANVCSEQVGSWISIGDYTNLNITYDGIFDGNDNLIDNIYINSTTTRAGLFGNTSSVGLLKNIVINSGSVFAPEVIGAVVGRNWGTVDNCKNIGCTVTAWNNYSKYVTIGGIVGANMKGGSVIRCSNSATVSSELLHIGGIVGLSSGYVNSCSNYGEIKGGKNVGGIIGYQHNDGTENLTISVEFSENHGYVKGQYYVGGIVGYSDTANIYNCKNEYAVESTDNDYSESGRYWSRTGGIVGFVASGNLAKCYNSADIISVYGCVGGIAGFSDISIKECYNLGSIKVTSNDKSTNIGGIVGRINNSTLSYSYNFGDINTITGYVGGITGQNSGGTVKYTYNAGKVTISDVTTPSSDIGKAESYLGHVVGYNIGTCSNNSNTDKSSIILWDDNTIKQKLGNNFKKGSTYPILTWQN